MVTDRKEAGTRLDAVYPSFSGACDLELSLPEPDAIAQAADVAFLAVPHTAAHGPGARAPDGRRRRRRSTSPPTTA